MIDLNREDIQVAKAFVRLREPGNEALYRLLSSEMELAKTRLTHADDMVSIHRLQGRVQAFEDLLRAVDDAPKVLTRA